MLQTSSVSAKSVDKPFNQVPFLWCCHSMLLRVYSSRLTYICDFIGRGNFPLSSLVPSESYEDYVSRSSVVIKQIISACPSKGRGFRSLNVLSDTCRSRNWQRFANRSTFNVSCWHCTELKVKSVLVLGYSEVTYMQFMG